MTNASANEPFRRHLKARSFFVSMAFILGLSLVSASPVYANEPGGGEGSEAPVKVYFKKEKATKADYLRLRNEVAKGKQVIIGVWYKFSNLEKFVGTYDTSLAVRIFRIQAQFANGPASLTHLRGVRKRLESVIDKLNLLLNAAKKIGSKTQQEIISRMTSFVLSIRDDVDAEIELQDRLR